MLSSKKKRRNAGKKAARAQREADDTLEELAKKIENQDEMVHLLTQTEMGKSYPINHRHPGLQMSLLDVACQFNLVLVLLCVLNRKEVDVNAYCNVSGDNKTPLYRACEMGNLECVKLLCQHPRIDMNLPSTRESVTPFEAAVFGGHKAVVKYLLNDIPDAVIDYNRTRALSRRSGEFQKSPLMFSISGGNKAITKLLLAHPRINRKPIEAGLNAMDYACYAGSLAMVQMLEAQGFPPPTSPKEASVVGRVRRDNGVLTERRAVLDDYVMKDECKPCSFCHEDYFRKELKRCSGCLEVWYCGQKCQKADWNEHKPNCCKKIITVSELPKIIEVD
jgi:ankyrin repeat protein